MTLSTTSRVLQSGQDTTSDSVVSLGRFTSASQIGHVPVSNVSDIIKSIIWICRDKSIF